MTERSGTTPRSIELEFGSSLAADRDEVWSVVTTMRGVNDELHPFIHMTSGHSVDRLPDTVTPGAVLLQSWLLLFRVLPIDRHGLALDEVDVGHGFVEESTSWLQRRWRHERRLTADGDRGCLVVDRLVIEPRVRLSLPFVAVVVRGLFGHRHRRLRRRFGTA